MKKIVLLWACLFFIEEIKCQIFFASPNQLCTEGNNFSFNINASGLPTQSSQTYGFYEVCVNINHPIASDIHLVLESPAGTLVTLTENNGGTGNFNNACFRVYARNAIQYSNAPFGGAYMARDVLWNLTDNQDPNGTWKLHYDDNVLNAVSGTLTSWSIHFSANPHVLALNNSSSNLPIFKLTIPSGFIPDDPKTQGILNVVDNGSGTNFFSATTFNGTYNLAIERQGYTSAWGDKPNYDFELQNATGNDTSIALLNLPPESDWILKSCYTDEYMMKDPLTFEMSRRMGYYAPRTKFVELMINTEYVGLYILEEKLKRDSNRINIAKLTPSDTVGAELTGGYVFEINPNGDAAAWYSNYQGYQGALLTSNYEYKVVYPRQNSIHPNQLNYIHSYVDSFENALQGVNYQDPTIGWRKYASEKDLIDFLIVSEYSTNYDTYGRSMYLYKEKSTDGNKIHCGPPWDADRGYVSDTGWVHIVTHGYWVFPFWWQRLRTDSVFNKRLACRFAELRKEVLSDTAFISLIDELHFLSRNAAQRNTNRWQNYVENVYYLKLNVSTRLAWMDSKLQGNIYPPIPSVSAIYCTGDPVSFFAGNQYTYNIIPGPDTNYFVPTTTGNYVAQMSTIYGCMSAKPFTVMVPPQPLIAGNQYPCKNTSAVYTINNIIGSSYVWTIIGGTPIAGCGSSDSSCMVLWGNPTFSEVRVKQSLTASCVDSSVYAVAIQVCTGVNDIAEENSIFMYPNPAADVLYIQHDKAIYTAEIIDATGRILITKKDASSINVSSLCKGIYQIRITDEANKRYATTFLKE